MEARNRLDSLIYQTEKTYDEHKEKLGPDEKGELEAALADAKKALEGEPSASRDGRGRRAPHQGVAQAGRGDVPQQPGGGAGQGPGGCRDRPAARAPAGSAGVGAADEVIDAEYVEK